MDSPVAVVKQGVNPMRIILLIVGLFVVFAIFDFLNLTDWILYPVTNAKSKFGKSAATILPFAGSIVIGAATMGAFAIGA